MANVYDISIEQGSSFNMLLTATDSLGYPLNLSGYNARGVVKYSYGSTGYLANLNPIVDPSYVSGLVTVSMTSVQTAVLPITKGVYDIEVYDSFGYAFKAVRGYAEIIPEATNI